MTTPTSSSVRAAGPRPFVVAGRLVLLAALLAVGAGWTSAFASLFVFVGGEDGAEVRLAPGSSDTIPVVTKLRDGSGNNVASLNLRLTWDPALVTVDEVIPGTFGSLTLNEQNLASGELRASLFNASGDTASFDALQLVLRAGSSEALANVDVEVLTAGDELGRDITSRVATRNLAVCVGVSGVLGDLTGDGTSDVTDARELARWALGLAVGAEVAQAAESGLGDGNGDGATNVVDAQQVARHAAGLTVGGRIGQVVQGNCASAVPEVTFTQVAAGFDHACALSQAGDVYCWGGNGSGELGVGTQLSSVAPVKAQMPVAAVQVDVDGNVSCALGTDGVAYCWGDNASGKTGTGSVGGNVTVPTAVAGGLTFAGVDVGERGSCAWTADGALHCWGVNVDAALGNGIDSPCVAGASPLCSATPVAAHPAYAFQEVSIGLWHTCGMLTDGTAVCWGQNSFGQVGIGGARPPDGVEREPIQPTGGLNFVHLDVGVVSSCGITSAGRSFCWGSDFFGSLGLGGNASSDAPAELPGTSFDSFALTVENNILAHGCALDTSGRAWCWGADLDGGVGSEAPTVECTFGASRIFDCYDRPVPVEGDLRFASLSAGGNFTCGVTEGGRVFCWGQNDVGQLGDGSATHQFTPSPTLRPGLGITVHGVQPRDRPDAERRVVP